jgi:hypothetical protein
MGKGSNRRRRPPVPRTAPPRVVVQPTTPELAAQREARFAAVLETVEEHDLEALLTGWSLTQQRALASVFQLRVDPGSTGPHR